MIQKIIKWLKQKYNECFFIGSSDKLPPPLSSEEERECILKSQQGDMEAKNKLIEHNLRLVVFLAKKYENTGYDMEDLVSIGSIGLIKGINTYKLDKNIKLATYASRCIANEILMFLRKSKKLKTEVSFEEPLNADLDGNELLLQDILATDYDIVYKNVENGVEKQILWQVILKLPQREQEIMLMRFGLNGVEEKTQKEVADMMNISQSYISRIEKKILGKMEKEMKRLYS